MLIYISSYHSWRIAINNIRRLSPLMKPTLTQWGGLFNPIQHGVFSDSSRMEAGGGGQTGPLSIKSVTHILQWRTLAVIPYLKKVQKIWITWHTPWVLLKYAFFHQKSANFAISRNTDIDCNLIHNFLFF